MTKDTHLAPIAAEQMTIVPASEVSHPTVRRVVMRVELGPRGDGLSGR